MPLYLDTRGRTSLAVRICDRCGFKFPIGDLRKDRNNPSGSGLWVCAKDNDTRDPYTLPARKPDPTTIPNGRADSPIDDLPTS